MGEQPLAKNSACNLSSLNLSEFVINPYEDNALFDFAAFEKATIAGIRFLDQIVDLNAPRHPLKEQRNNSLNYRNCGLGVFGYAVMLMKMGITYGSDEAIKLTRKIFNDMFRTAVKASSDLAGELGSFPMYNENVWNSTIVQKHFTNSEIDKMKEKGLRNCSVLSVAPTGSIATMLGESGGAEPQFALTYTRRTVGLTDNQDHYYEMHCKSVEDYLKKHPEDKDHLPAYFVSAPEIDPMRRVLTQAIMQDSVDTAISSTINLPESCSEEDMAKIYIEAWKRGLKGLTVFRANCERQPILSSGKQVTKKKHGDHYDKIKPISRKTIGTTSGNTYCKKCACGTLYVTINRDSEGNVVESFVHTSKGGICQANVSAINRLVSLGLRSGIQVEEIADQIRGITCPACVKVMTKGNKLSGISCPDIISKALIEFYEENKRNVDACSNTQSTKECRQHSDDAVHGDGVSTCPDCGAPIQYEGGCRSCSACGWSKCD